MKTKSVAFIYVGLCMFEPYFLPSMIFATHVAFTAFMVSMMLSFWIFVILQDRENSARHTARMVEAISCVLGEHEDRAVSNKGWIPWVVLSETMLDQHMAAAETGPTHVVRNFIGWAGTHRFACVFATPDEQNPVRLVWVLAGSEAWARSAWPQLGETHAPKAVLAIETLAALRDQVRQVRFDRGDGALTDGRPFEHLAERVVSLARERAGDDVWQEEQRKFAERMAGLGSTP